MSNNPSSNRPSNSAQPVRRRNSAVKPAAPTRSAPGWIDWLILVFVLVIGGLSLYFTVQAGALNVSLFADSQWAWHLVRGCGMIAYTLMAASTLWGVFLSSRLVKDWSPGPLSLLLHATTSWLAVLFAIAHAVLLLWDGYYHYEVSDLLVPFTGPYRPLPVGLGIISLWLTVAITLSFSVRKRIGQRLWQWLHYTSYAGFALISVHAFFSGTDAVQPGLRLVLIGFSVSVAVLFIVRVAQSLGRRTAR